MSQEWQKGTIPRERLLKDDKQKRPERNSNQIRQMSPGVDPTPVDQPQKEPSSFGSTNNSFRHALELKKRRKSQPAKKPEPPPPCPRPQKNKKQNPNPPQKKKKKKLLPPPRLPQQPPNNPPPQKKKGRKKPRQPGPPQFPGTLPAPPWHARGPPGTSRGWSWGEGGVGICRRARGEKMSGPPVWSLESSGVELELALNGKRRGTRKGPVLRIRVVTGGRGNLPMAMKLQC